jgi:hypothetical protein
MIVAITPHHCTWRRESEDAVNVMKGPGKSDDSPGMQVTNPDPYAFTKSIKNPSNRENADVADIY